MQHLIDISNGQRTIVSAEDLLLSEKPLLLYFGCLHHIQDIDTKEPLFFDYMNQLCGSTNVRLIMPIDTHTSFDELMKIRANFNEGIIPPSPLAEFVYHNVFAPIIESCKDISDPVSYRQLQKSLSNISVLGYSYGTSLLQQVGVVMAHHLLSVFSAEPDKASRIFELCKSIKAIAIGPVSRQYQIDLDGSVSPLRYDDVNFVNAKTIFTQASFLMRSDKIVQRAYGDECLGGKLSSQTGIEVRETASMKLIIDYTERPTRMAMGFRQAASGELFPVIVDSFDPAVHHPRLYTNTSEMLGNIRVFPSIAISQIFRNALINMLNPEQDSTTWISAITDQLKTDEQKNSLVAKFQVAGDYYRNALEKVRSLTPIDAGEFLKDFVKISP